MAAEVRHFTVTVPITATIAAPQLTNLPMPARVVRRISVRVPRGTSSLVGFALASSGQPVIPWNAGEWFVADGEVVEWPLEGMIDSGAWQLRAYNLGRYPHTLRLTFELDLPQKIAPPGLPVFIPPGDLGGGDGGGGGGGGGGGDDTYQAGYDAARTNAESALDTALDVVPVVPRLTPPVAGSTAATGYADGKLAALTALVGIGPGAGGGGGGGAAGVAAARVNARAAIETAFGFPLDVIVQPVPAAGTADRAGYDAVKTATLVILGALHPG